MKIGYARVSTTDQTTALQIDALKQAGCTRIFEDTISGSTTKRPQLDRCLKALKPGDVLVVWKLDRLGRGLAHLISLIDTLRARSIGFRSLSEAIDTTSAQGKLVFHMMGALAEFERSLIAERTSAGRTAAKARGVRFGRKPKLTPQQIEHATKLSASGTPVVEIAQLLNVSKFTVYRAFREAHR